MNDLRKYLFIFVPFIVLTDENIIIEQNMIYTILPTTLFQLIEWVIILFLCVALVFIILRSLKKQQYLKYQLENNNQELKTISENTQIQVEQANTKHKDLKTLLEFKEEVTQLLIHDLKNLLSLMVNYELFSKEVLAHTTAQMLNIVTNIGDVQNYENTKMRLDIKEVQFLNILKNAYSQVEFLFTEKKLNYFNNIQEDLKVYADEKILERILVNLLMNAVKYTKQGDDISIIAEKEQGKVKISIIDTGNEIPDDIQNLIFDKFGLVVAKKSDASRSGNLGLSFCKLALEAHDEIIRISSDEKQTTFWFTLRGIGTERDVDKEPISHNDKSEVILSNGSKFLLKQYINELKSVEVYEFSAVRNIIKHIETFENLDIKSWVNNLKQAVKLGDEELYNNLIKLAE